MSMFRRFHSSVKSWVSKEGGPSTVVLGANGSGKTTLVNQLFSTSPVPSALVSFDSSLQFLKQKGHLSVGECCGGINSAGARAIVVRFGLMHCWMRKVEFLSSGELRKLILAVAVARGPSMLFLDGAHDGLDYISRKKLTLLLNALAKGFPPLLVSLGGNVSTEKKKNIGLTAMKTRILQCAMRAEEVPMQIDNWVCLKNKQSQVVTKHFGEYETKRNELLDAYIKDVCNTGQISRHHDWDKAYNCIFGNTESGNTESEPRLIVSCNNVNVSYADSEGLRNISWEIHMGDLWALLGANGSGKSTLARLFATPRSMKSEPSLAQVLQDKTTGVEAMTMDGNFDDQCNIFGSSRKDSYVLMQENIGFVSINSHMYAILASQIKPSITVFDVILSGLKGASVSGQLGMTALLLDFSATESESEKVNHAAVLVGLDEKVLSSPFSYLGLGAQRQALLARSLILAPKLLIWDEAFQGLDYFVRENAVKLLGYLHSKKSMAIVNIVHHSDEIPPTISHVLELEKGQTKYIGDPK